nr:MAG TPA: hypothetical protein [Herelleviridae sp.]
MKHSNRLPLVNIFREIALKEPKASLIGPKRANIDL